MRERYKVNMKSLDLCGEWQLYHCALGEGETLDIPSRGCPLQGALAAQVPGDVHMDMMRAGLISDPLYSRNAEDCRWMEEKDWWYSLKFSLPTGFLKDKAELHFAGVDTTCDVWLNGVHAASHSNMFIPFRADVGEALREGENLLVVRVDSGIRSAWAKDNKTKYPHISSLQDTGLPRMWVRKAQFTGGWDWGPRLLTCGIWRPVELRSYRTAAIRSVQLTSQLLDGRAKVRVRAAVESFCSEEKRLHLRAQLRDSKGASSKELEIGISAGCNTAELEIEVDNPSLWWPQPIGEPHLYDFVLELGDGREILDSYQSRFGIREVQLVQEPLSPDEGQSFTISVNGEKVFCKGANWAPADSILARADAERYRALISAAAEANFNMLRIWGGGIYENESFYSLCDEMGIMVWQDFLYACSLYPDDDPSFHAEVRQEAEEAVKELRNHPSLVLWCGNNENDWIYYRRIQAGWDLPVFYGQRIYHEILPEVCARLDPSRPYWPSSPYGGEDPNSELLGDRHNWEVGVQADEPSERVDFRKWGEDRAKFMSEFGVLAPPVRESLERFVPPGDLYVGSPGWQYHNNQFEKGNLAAALELYCDNPTKIPLDQYLIGTQLVQAEALKYAVEHFRRRKFDCSGVLFWQFNDVWGAISWSILDYYLSRKPSYYYVRRAYAPLLLSFKEEVDGCSVWLTNDNLQAYSGRLEYGILDLSSSKWDVQERPVVVKRNCSSKVAELELPSLSAEEKSKYVVCGRFIEGGQVLARNRLFPSGFRFKDLRLPEATLEQEITSVGPGEFRLRVKSDDFAWAVQLRLPPGVWVEDNYFDMLPGEEKKILIKGEEDAVRSLAVVSSRAPQS